MTQSVGARAREMSAVAGELIDRLPQASRALASTTGADPAWRQWTYLPGDRPGLPLADAPHGVIESVDRLIRLAHSRSGADLVTGAVEVERERRRLVTGEEPDGDRYWFRVFGDPGSALWSWRLNGHHVGVHVVINGESATFTPHFIGAEPARLPQGGRAGHRLLGAEEDLARALLASLTPGERERAIAADRAPDDILTGMDPVADPSVLPSGIRRTELSPGQRRRFDALTRRYLDRAPAAYADACWEEALATPDDLEFAWAGSTEIGGPHYYCVKSPIFLIEYDNTQDDANHAHSVWRHLRDDFGGDALREHHRREHGLTQ